jgi:hypothetical protein
MITGLFIGFVIGVVLVFSLCRCAHRPTPTLPTIHTVARRDERVFSATDETLI